MATGSTISGPAAPSVAHFLSSKTILIAGAGIAGLTFVIALLDQFGKEFPHHVKPRILVFERDSHEARVGREGYTMSLRADGDPGGLQVLNKLGLYEQVISVSTSAHGAEAKGAFCIWDTRWNEVLRFRIRHQEPNILLGIRIRRNSLQKVLADAAVKVGAEIHWESGIEMMSVNDHGGIDVTLKDGRTERGDILIAADGSGSKIRSILRPSDNLDYTGVVFMGGTSKFSKPESVPRPMNADWGIIASGKGIGLFVSPVDECSALWSLSYPNPTPIDRIRPPMPAKEAQVLLGQAEELGAHFGSKLHTLIKATDPSTLMLSNAMDRPAFPQLPLKHGPVVWIGDSNHAVSPFAGNGANLAIMDAYDLARHLIRKPSLEEALTEYDKSAIPRAQETLTHSRRNIKVLHSTGWTFLFYRVVFHIMGFFIRLRG